MEEKKNLIEKFNNIDFMKDDELEKLDFYELSMYCEFLNVIEDEYNDTVKEEVSEA